jgi:hypothetical protein
VGLLDGRGPHGGGQQQQHPARFVGPFEPFPENSVFNEAGVGKLRHWVVITNSEILKGM